MMGVNLNSAMECNKEEAARAKELAEKKMNNKDYVGARSMLIKAQKLYPSIQNVDQMLTICQVHCSAEREVGSDVDWYDILQIDQTADNKSITKKYKKLALQLHPDKNKSPGTQAAFQFVTEAHSFLLDQSKRAQYDMKHHITKQQSPSQNHADGQATTFWTRCPFCKVRYKYYIEVMNTSVCCQTCRLPFVACEFLNNERMPCGVPEKKDAPSQDGENIDMKHHNTRQQTQSQNHDSRATFWTRCPICKTRYQYYIKAMNVGVLCQSCHVPFVACEFLNNKWMPCGVSEKKDAPSQDCQQNSQVNVQGNRSNVAPAASQPPTTSGSASVDGAAMKPNAKEDFDVRVEETSIPAEPEPLGTNIRKRGRNSESEKDSGSFCDMEEDGDQKDGQNSGLNSGRRSRQKHDVSYKENSSDDEDISSGSRRETTNEPLEKEKRKVLVEESTPYGDAENRKNNGGEEDDNFQRPEPVVVEIAHPEFYDFDKDKSEQCFAPGQMWALFDDLDGMPRLYAQIDKVYNLPFKVDITWLEFVAGDTDQTAWKRSRLPVACGKFKHEITDTVEDRGTFSHKIVCEGDRNTYKIYPQKGEIWALYKNWNNKWSSEPVNHREYEYEFVVVLSDYNNGSGILVTQLVKLQGFVCLFKVAETNGMSSFQIPSSEMLKFSHRVPSFRTNGRERKDVPEGCFELDPASLPSYLEGLFDSIDGKSKTVGCQRGHFGPDPNSVPNNLDRKAETVGGGRYRSLKSIYRCDLPKRVLYSFDGDKTEDKFVAGQVWALYCDLDGLPKFYGLIKKVELIPEFKVNIQWLEACTSSKGMLNWLDNTMPVCCGVFSGGTEKEFDDTRYFSHLSKGAKPAIKNKYVILPRKGEVWAVYKDFCSEWSSSDLRTCKYDIGKVVKVDDSILKVLVLEKVGDYETIFKVQRKAGCKSVLKIPLRELVRFSHRIPAIQLTDEKSRTLLTDKNIGGSLRGFLELDPKAMPVCL